MTDPVNEISRTQESASGGAYSGGGHESGQRKKRPNLPQHDLVEISRDARNRAAGKKNPSLWERLKELLG